VPLTPGFCYEENAACDYGVDIQMLYANLNRPVINVSGAIKLPLIHSRSYGGQNSYDQRPDVVINSSVPINIVYFAALFFLAFLSIKRGWWDLFALILPALHLYGIQSFLTHNLARYNKPLTFLLLSCCLLCIA
jgi:hypothetical protein